MNVLQKKRNSQPAEASICTVRTLMHKWTVILLLSMIFIVPLYTEPKATVNVAGIQWYNTLEAAKRQAQREKKPILHLQMFGRIDDAYC